jgi:hypothetical protein
VALFDEDDLAAYLQVSSVNSDTFDLLAELVEGEIESETGDVDDLTTAQALRAKAIGLEVAARAYRNPGGFTTEAIDDWRGSRDAGALGVYLTAAERARLRQLVADADSTTTGSLALRPTWRSW